MYSLHHFMVLAKKKQNSGQIDFLAVELFGMGQGRNRCKTDVCIRTCVYGICKSATYGSQNDVSRIIHYISKTGENKMNVPNTLTVLRVIMIPFFVLFMLGDITSVDKYIALGIFIAASLTDTLDGYLARKNNQVTNFGKFMDPLADKLLVCAAMICLMDLDRLPSWIVIIIISREFIISGFRLIAADNGIVIAASWWGKAKTISQMIMIILLVADFGGVFDMIGQVMIYLALVLTVVSLVDYIAKNKQVLKMQN